MILSNEMLNEFATKQTLYHKKSKRIHAQDQGFATVAMITF